jgi:3-methylcrotonyl-CoA carboxylase alpha subunit
MIVKAPSALIIQMVSVKEGEKVKEGDTLMMGEVMKNMIFIASPTAGKISRIYYSPGALVQEGASLIKIEEGE